MSHDTIPGMIDVQGREFFYLELRDKEVFRTLIDQALAANSEVPMPNAGGIIEEKVRILLNGGKSLLGISYKGDLAGWKGKLVAYCEATDRKWGIASGRKLTL